MGYRPPWLSNSAASTSESLQHTTQEQSNMSLMAMATPSPHAGFKREYPWDGPVRTADYRAPHYQGESERVSLPSIHQDANTSRTAPSTTSPTTTLTSALTSPEYIHSPNLSKRRRLSIEDDRERESSSRVPRGYEAQSAQPPAQQQQQQQLSPTTRPAADSWASVSRPAAPYTSQAPMPPMRTAGPLETPHDRHDRRSATSTLPGPQAMSNYERQPPSQVHPPRAAHGEEYPPMRTSAQAQQPPPPPPPGAAPPTMESGSAYGQSAPYTYSYHHPSRAQSMSVGAVQHFERSPFTSGGYGAGSHYPEFVRIGELGGGMGMHGDSRHRKRRGNLPKETTDKLRAWFLAHLQHPYPTEDEKQELMRQTGLQMNQISNWFINARRRQLPTMINNARVESEALGFSKRKSSLYKRKGSRKDGDDDDIIPSTERRDYHGADGQERSSVPLSDGEGSHYEEDMTALDQRHVAHQISRGSV